MTVVTDTRQHGGYRSMSRSVTRVNSTMGANMADMVNESERIKDVESVSPEGTSCRSESERIKDVDAGSTMSA